LADEGLIHPVADSHHPACRESYLFKQPGFR